MLDRVNQVSHICQEDFAKALIYPLRGLDMSLIIACERN
jgi:hypothetical protein